MTAKAISGICRESIACLILVPNSKTFSFFPLNVLGVSDTDLADQQKYDKKLLNDAPNNFNLYLTIEADYDRRSFTK